jgi:hypothetical protein
MDAEGGSRGWAGNPYTVTPEAVFVVASEATATTATTVAHTGTTDTGTGTAAIAKPTRDGTRGMPAAAMAGRASDRGTGPMALVQQALDAAPSFARPALVALANVYVLPRLLPPGSADRASKSREVMPSKLPVPMFSSARGMYCLPRGHWVSII